VILAFLAVAVVILLFTFGLLLVAVGDSGGFWQ
jgi:hypothetical protein